MSNNPLFVGIVGCGAITQKSHIPAFLRNKNTKLVALCDTNEDFVAGVADKYNIDRYYLDLSDMLKNEDLDLLDICTPISYHAAMAIQGMESGCHILVEKPLAIDTNEADNVIKASERNNVKLCVVHNRLFQPIMMKTMSLINEGIIGDPIIVEIIDGLDKNLPRLLDSNHWSHKLPAGNFTEHLPHSLYIAEKLIGPFKQLAVYAKKLTDVNWLMADELRLLIESDRGIATVTASCNFAKTTNIINIFGKKKHLHVDVYSSTLTTSGDGNENRPQRALDNLGQAFQQINCTFSTAFNTVIGKHPTGHENLIRQFVLSIQNNTQSPVTGYEGSNVVKALEMITTKMGIEVEGQY
jgi:predicted dehydrogenase